MTVAALIPGLDDLVRRGDPKQSAEAVRRISELFLQGAERFRPDHVDLFDSILTDLTAHTDADVRAELSERLSAIVNAPPMLMRELVRANDINIAGPLLRRSPAIDERMLIDIAMVKGQPHLLAMSERTTLPPDLTDVIVRRGDRDVARRVASNSGARFSEIGYSGLIKRAGDDGVLALAVGQREDISDTLLKDLLAKSADVIRRRLFEVAKPAKKSAINHAMIEISGGAGTPRRDFAAAQREILALHHANRLDEGALLGFAKDHKYEQSMAALSAMSGVRISIIDRLITENRNDPILVIGKSAGLKWATVRALILLRLGVSRVPSATDMEEARINYERLVPSTAERVLSFWQTRRPA